MTYMKVKASDQAKEQVKTSTDSISTSSTTLTYKGQSDGGASKFTYTDANDREYVFEFNL